MKIIRIIAVFVIVTIIEPITLSGQQAVSKTNAMPVYMHYMPWFDTPETVGGWGWHWTMNTRNPNNINASTGQRDIASHFYPLIGPYASRDKDVLEYHLLLMKLSGIDGVLIDWYGKQGSNGDVQSLLTNSNAIVEASEKFGLKFAVVMEDRFSRNIADAQANIAYLDENYFTSANYLRIDNNPVVSVFGPITFQQPAQWTDILSASDEAIEFLTLWQESGDAGTNADGEYAWIWEDENLGNYLSVLESFYKTRAPSLKTVMGVAYPGFLDYYKEGGAGDNLFKIPHDNGETLNKTLALANTYKSNFDVLQLATWNDFGEGTIFEPTYETGFGYLEQIQKFTGVSYGVSELLMVYKLYSLRKIYKDNAAKTEQLDQASVFLNNLQIAEAKAILDEFEVITGAEDPQSDSIEFQLYPNPLKGKTLHIRLSGKRDISELKVTITDLQGKEIARELLQKKDGLFSMSAEKITKGAYIVNMNMTEKIVATRLLVLE